MRIVLCLIILVGTNIWARPTTNVTNALYSVSDDFFVRYGFPELTFRERVVLFDESKPLEKDTNKLGAQTIGDKYSMSMLQSNERYNYYNFLYIKLIRDKKKKRDLLCVFHQQTKNEWTKLLRVDVFQYDKKVVGRWKVFDAAQIIPKLTWNDIYKNLPDKKESDQVFTMRPAIEIEFRKGGYILTRPAIQYIQNELSDVSDYISENELKERTLYLKWNGDSSKFIKRYQ